MRLTPEIMDEFYRDMKSIRRASWPDGDCIMADSAEEGTLWYYSYKNDELTKDYGIGFHDLPADDWEFSDS